MKSSRITFVLSLLFAMCVLAASTAAAQKTGKPIVTDYPPYLCLGGGFVAMVGSHTRLVLIRIDDKGIEPRRPFRYPTMTSADCNVAVHILSCWTVGKVHRATFLRFC